MRGYNMNKRVLFSSIIILLISGLTFTSCSSKEPIKIGFAGGFTGNNSAVAVSGRDAVQLAITEINAQGGLLGREVVLVSKDDNSDMEQTKIVDTEFIKEGVPVVIGHMMSGVAPAMMEAISGQNILMIAPTVSTHTLTNIDDNFMRTTLTNSDQGSFMARFIREKQNKSKLMVLYSNTNKTFIEGMKPAVTDTFKDLGGNIVYEQQIEEKNTQQMEKAVLEAIDKGADSVALLMNAGDVAMFSQILKKENVDISVYSGTWGMTSEVIKLGGQAVEGVMFPSQFDPTSTSEKYLEFKTKYQNTFKAIPDFGAIYSYDTAMVIFEAIKKAHSVEPDKIKQAIIDIETFEGLQQEFKINEFGDTECDHFMFMIKNGEFVNVDNIK